MTRQTMALDDTSPVSGLADAPAVTPNIEPVPDAALSAGKVEGLTKRAAAGTAWSTLSTAGKQLLTFASLTTVARMLGPSSYGIMGMAALVMAFINNFRDLGTAVVIVQRPALSDRLLSSLFWVNVVLGVFMSAVVTIMAAPVAGFFHTPELASVLRVIAISFLIASVGVVHGALLTRQMAFRSLALIDLGAAVLTYMVALTCALHHQGVWSLVYANITNSMATTLGYWFAFRFRPRLVFDVAEVKTVAGFSSNLSSFAVVNYAYRNADNLVVGKVLGSVQLGFYGMAYNMMLTPLQNISSVIVQVLFPAFSRIQDDNERFRSAYLRGCMLIGLLTFPVMAGLAVVADPLVRALLGPKWLGTIPIFQILAPVGLIQSVQTTVGLIYQSKGRADWMFRWSLVVLAASLTAFVVGVRYGAVGVAAAYALVYIGLLVYPGFLIPFRLIHLKFSDFAAALLPQLGWTLVMVLACSGWLYALAYMGFLNPWLRLISSVIIGTLVYAGTILAFRPPVVRYLEDILESSGSRPAVRVLTLLRWRRAAAGQGQ